MTVIDLIEEWFKANKMERFLVYRGCFSENDLDDVSATIRYNHTRLVGVGNGSHYPEWLFYEIMTVSAFEVTYHDINKKLCTLNAHDPEFFPKFEAELKEQIRRIENNTTEAIVAQRVMFGFAAPPPESATSL